MFEQFTKEARGVVVDAQTVARSLHTRTIDTRHLVVALCESDGLEGVAGRGRGARKHIPFTPDAKKTLELSLREAIRLGSKGINSGHLLLGILRSRTPATPVVEEALRTAGVDAPALRTAAEQQSRPA